MMPIAHRVKFFRANTHQQAETCYYTPIFVLSHTFERVTTHYLFS